jgi:hypothetical protein
MREFSQTCSLLEQVFLAAHLHDRQIVDERLVSFL